MSDAIWPDMIDADVAVARRAERLAREDATCAESGVSANDIQIGLYLRRGIANLTAGRRLGWLSSDGRRP